jgi:hypothetical protein
MKSSTVALAVAEVAVVVVGENTVENEEVQVAVVMVVRGGCILTSVRWKGQEYRRTDGSSEAARGAGIYPRSKPPTAYTKKQR